MWKHAGLLYVLKVGFARNFKIRSVRISSNFAVIDVLSPHGTQVPAVESFSDWQVTSFLTSLKIPLFIQENFINGIQIKKKISKINMLIGTKYGLHFKGTKVS